MIGDAHAARQYTGGGAAPACTSASAGERGGRTTGRGLAPPPSYESAT